MPLCGIPYSGTSENIFNKGRQSKPAANSLIFHENNFHTNVLTTLYEVCSALFL